MVIELKRDAQANIVLNQLYKLTNLQTSFGINLLAIVHGEPRLLSLYEILRHFVDHRKDVTLRRCRFELRKAEARAHIWKASRSPSTTSMRSSRSSGPARPVTKPKPISCLASASVKNKLLPSETGLRRLTGMERDEIIAELEAVRAEIARLRAILEDEGLLLNLIEEEMVAVRDQYGDERRTGIVAAAGDFDLEDLIPVEDMVVTVSHEGYVKRVSVEEYRTQRRGGRGKSDEHKGY